MLNRVFISAMFASAAVAAGAQAEFVSFGYTSANSGLSATGNVNCVNGVAISGSITVAGSDTMDGTYTLYDGTGGYSPSNYFIYDNLLDCSSEQHLTASGLLFVSEAGDEVNLWGNSVTSYSLYGWVHGNGQSYSPADDGGTFSLVIPSPGAIALMGVAGAVGGRRRRA